MTQMTKEEHSSRVISQISSSVISELRKTSIIFRTVHRPRTFERTFRQSIFSLVFDLGGLIAGFLMVTFFVTISDVKWGLLLYPGVLSARGVIGGIFSGRISSGLHTGSISPTFSNNRSEFRLLWRAVTVLTLESCILLSTLSFVMGILFLGLQIVDIVSIVIVITSTMALSLGLVAPVTAAVSFWSFKKGMDPDVIVYPIMSTVADITVSLIYVSILSFFFVYAAGPILVAIPALLLIILAVRFLRVNSNKPAFHKTIRETFLTLVIVSIIVNITGTVLQSVNNFIGNKPEIYLIYPALLDTMGDVGSIVGSTATTKISLGEIEPSLRAIRHHLSEILAAITAGFVMCSLYSIIAANVLMLSFINLLLLELVLFLTALIASFLMSSIAFMVAIQIFKIGLDPDNFVIPIESSLADTVTSTALLIVLILLMY